MAEHDNHDPKHDTKKLYLASSDKQIAGVCAGIADYLAIDPTVVRLAWTVVTLVTGVVPGIVAYIVAILIVPKYQSQDLGELHSAHAGG